jgi:hypothetical protein
MLLAEDVKRVGELNFALHAGAGLCNGIPDGGFESVTAEDADARWSVFDGRFLDETNDTQWFGGASRTAFHGRDSVAPYVDGFHFADSDCGAALRFASAEELESDGFSGGYDDVGQKNGKWLVTKNGPGAADGVSETAWLGLQDIFHTNHSAKVIDLSREILLAAMTKVASGRRE